MLAAATVLLVASHVAAELPDRPQAFRRLWSRDDVQAATPVGDQVYLMARRTLEAVDAQGRTLWSHSEPPEGKWAGCGFDSTPQPFEDLVIACWDQTIVGLDSSTGTIRWRWSAPGRDAAPLRAGDSLLVRTSGDKFEARLTLLDVATGRPRTAVDLEGLPRPVLLHRGLLVAQLFRTLVGLDPETLAVRWRTPLAGQLDFLAAFEGSLWVLGRESSDSCSLTMRAVDERTGALGDPAPGPQPCAPNAQGGPLLLTWASRSRSTLARHDPMTGARRWEAALPFAVEASLPMGDRLIVLGVDGNAAVLSWEDGRLLKAARAPACCDPNVSFGAVDDADDDSTTHILLVPGPQSLVAIDTTAFEPVGDARTETLRLLGALRGSDDHRHLRALAWEDTAREIASLGPEAVGAVLDALPELSGAPLGAAAVVLTKARPVGTPERAAERLARRPDEQAVEAALLAAIEAFPESGPVVLGGVVRDESRHGATRLGALQQLSRAGSVELAVALAMDASRVPSRSWWSPPSPDEFLPLLGAPDLPERLKQASIRSDEDGTRRIAAALAASRVVVQGKTYVVFASPWLGSNQDIWIAEIGSDGRPREARFAGRGPEVAWGKPLLAQADGAAIVVSGALRIDLGEVAADSDADGLTNLVERRLGLSPQKGDTDGDGVRDADDVAPNASTAAKSDEDDFHLAVMAQVVGMGQRFAQDGVAFVTGTRALEWRGRSGPMVTVTPELRGELPPDVLRYATLYMGRPSTPQRVMGDQGLAVLPGEMEASVGYGGEHAGIRMRRFGRQCVFSGFASLAVE